MFQLIPPALTTAILIAGGAAMAQQTVTLINVFEVPEERYEETVAMWEAARDVMKAQPGYVATSLHTALDEGATFRLVNIAEWESPAHFQAAAKALKEAETPKVQGLKFHPMLYHMLRQDPEN